jgi:hypothetical protein
LEWIIPFKAAGEYLKGIKSIKKFVVGVPGGYSNDHGLNPFSAKKPVACVGLNVNHGSGFNINQNIVNLCTLAMIVLGGILDGCHVQITSQSIGSRYYAGALSARAWNGWSCFSAEYSITLGSAGSHGKTFQSGWNNSQKSS